MGVITRWPWPSCFTFAVLVVIVSISPVPNPVPVSYIQLEVLTPVLAIYGSVVPFPPYPVDIAVYGSIASIALSLTWTIGLRMSAGHRLEAAMLGVADD